MLLIRKAIEFAAEKIDKIDSGAQITKCLRIDLSTIENRKFEMAKQAGIEPENLPISAVSGSNDLAKYGPHWQIVWTSNNVKYHVCLVTDAGKFVCDPDV